MSATNVTARICEWAEAARYEDIPRRVTEEAKNQILSTIAAVHAGYFSEVGRAIRRGSKEWVVAKEATILPSGDRVSIYDALAVNCALAHALEYDDYLFSASTGASSVLVTLALAEKIGFNGKEFLAAQVVANEIGGRVGAAVLDPRRPFLSHPIVHQTASALVTAKVLGFERDRIAATIGLALAQPTLPPAPECFGSDARVFWAASTVPIGVRAGHLVATGVLGPVDVLDPSYGLLAGLNPDPLYGAFEGIGSVWLSESLCYKPYPGCATIDAAVDCVLDLVRQHSIDAKKVKSVSVQTVQQVLDMEEVVAPHLNGPQTPPSTLNLSIRYSLAAALMDRELSARQFTKDRVQDAPTWDLAERISLAPDPALEERARSSALVRSAPAGQGRELVLEPMRVNHYRPAVGARVRIELHDGRSFEAEQEIPQGAAGRMFDDRRKVVQDKFRRETRYTLRKEKMEKAVDVILHLDQANAAGLRELVRLCCSERG